MSRIQTWLAVAVLTLLGSAGSLHAEPIDLTNRTPRDIYVRFERSPRATPAALDRVYTELLPARFLPGPAEHIFVVIEGRYVAEHLFAGQEAVADSFGDFVWTFDSATGDVVEARVEGEIIEFIDWGFGTSTTRAHINVRMSTREAAGFREGQRVFGQQIFRHCDPQAAGWSECHAVAPVAFDRKRGYVNAVGVIEVETRVGIQATSFSPLGEAIFLENTLPAVSAPETLASATTSPDFVAPVE